MQVSTIDGVLLFQGPASIGAGLEFPADVVVKHTGAEHRDIVRARIAREAGDAQKLLGVTNDIACMAAIGLAQVVRALENAETVLDIREAMSPLSEISGRLLGAIESGQIVVPVSTKDVDKVFAELALTSNAISRAISG